MLTKLGGFGIGYVPGARAGKDRYEQIRLWAGQAARGFEAHGSGESPVVAALITGSDTGSAS